MSKWLALTVTLLLSAALVSPAPAQSRRGELRGAWMGDGYGRDWPAIMQKLKENGFNALFPNFSMGNTALYPSKTLAVAPGAAEGRDELAEAAKAARETGIELHVRRTAWALLRTPAAGLAELDAAGRLQSNSRGQRGKDDPSVAADWLCPSNPENRKLEKESALELVRSYDIAGIQLDYMRYPGGDYCFCDGCKERFQQSAGVKVGKWPEEVLEGGPLAAKWSEWRRGLITGLVREISDGVHALKPGVAVSVAAWPEADAGRDAYGQDWVAWVRDGTLDFVCPVDGGAGDQELARLVRRQVADSRGAVPMYVVLGAFQVKSAWQLTDQIGIARSEGADGFVAYSYEGGELEKWLPELRATVTAEDPSPMPHRSPPARFAMSGEATNPPATGRDVIAGAKLEVEMVVGWEPPAAGQDDSGAAAAGAMLDRILNQRLPGDIYNNQPSGTAPTSAAERISGRIVVESPEGAPLLAVGRFDTEWRFERKLTIVAPEGPFRVAIYGAVSGPGGKREFVLRTRLMVGVKG